MGPPSLSAPAEQKRVWRLRNWPLVLAERTVTMRTTAIPDNPVKTGGRRTLLERSAP